MKYVLLALVLFGVIACEPKDKVSWHTQETQRTIAIENSQYNARNFRLANPQYASYNIIGMGDSTIGPNCANGDGWATVRLVKMEEEKPTTNTYPFHTIDHQRIVELKCSTASINIGCILKTDFMKRKYAGQEGHCNTNLPVPMPKLVK